MARFFIMLWGLLLGASAPALENNLPELKHGLHFTNAVETWDEALPLGNGRIGGMVFGGVRKEHIMLNESSVWSG